MIKKVNIFLDLPWAVILTLNVYLHIRLFLNLAPIDDFVCLIRQWFTFKYRRLKSFTSFLSKSNFYNRLNLLKVDAWFILFQILVADTLNERLILEMIIQSHFFCPKIWKILCRGYFYTIIFQCFGTTTFCILKAWKVHVVSIHYTIIFLCFGTIIFSIIKSWKFEVTVVWNTIIFFCFWTIIFAVIILLHLSSNSFGFQVTIAKI